MKIVAKSIEMVAWFDINGKPHPVRFKVSEGENCVIKIDRVIKLYKERIAGNDMLIFVCQSLIASNERLYEIKYEMCTCKWMLFKF
ncbi:hypothetical protein CFB3_15050 [Clostridium folliculivorans]|uniref:Uncharacterized protein n=1 Tax=Clostridium folliculivorans TaxID=2886038 RepID=A0A9W6D908_9CLOT|nr:hypothetical protein [Clostridium folliculivorans]GKU23282.1 hypothetical protein CFOLD11_01080 [Clostridium folliculivorans]GKU29399.1 hypothetical protein CFB3_15050 [Clostridium folliculivorans]